ncbi:MAG: hypothetical protein IT236_17445 [Bacteroidia bacterium]|nr:hypothetical protein [Bacteroidia bacterium]
MTGLSSELSEHLNEVLGFFHDTSDIYELPHTLDDYSDFVALNRRLSPMDNGVNLFGVYLFDGQDRNWEIHYFGVSSTLSFTDRLKFLAFPEREKYITLTQSKPQRASVNRSLAKSAVAGIKMAKIPSEQLRYDCLKEVISHFGTDKKWNV